MKRHELTVGGLAVDVVEDGSGPPLLYLHGFADLHGASPALLPFHAALAKHCRLIAPAHPGCGASAEDDEMETIGDVLFHYLRVIDALGLDRFALAGSSVGGWIAAEIAVHIPERIEQLALIGATGLFLPGQPIGDLFMMVQPEQGSDYSAYRRMLFRAADCAEALEMFPDGRMSAEREAARYRMFRFASRVGFKPPYFHNRQLVKRLDRYRGPALIVAGGQDGFVPASHARAYAEGFPGARLEILAGAGNSLIVERPQEIAGMIGDLMKG
jgi:pimeloyl-ACP methyl ester carboxylesterase